MGVLRLLAPIWFVFLGSLFWHFVAVVFGAPILSKLHETYSFALLLSCCTVFLPALILGDWYEFARIYFELDTVTKVDYILLYSSSGSIVGAWFGAFPIPLDWDRPWQEWPITCVVGTIFGFCAGVGIGIGVHKYNLMHRKWKLDLGKSV